MNASHHEELRYALAKQMAKRLRCEEDWVSTARWLLDQALEAGFDLSGLRENDPETWSHDLIASLSFHVDFEDYWPDGAVEDGTGETAESLFWELMPYPTGVRLPASLVGNAKEIGKSFSLTPEGRTKITGARQGFMRACFAVDAHRDGTGTIRLDWYETSIDRDYGSSDYFMTTELEAAREIVRILNENLPDRAHARTEYPPEDDES
jgi:hypothetical protein